MIVYRNQVISQSSCRSKNNNYCGMLRKFLHTFRINICFLRTTEVPEKTLCPKAKKIGQFVLFLQTCKPRPLGPVGPTIYDTLDRGVILKNFTLARFLFNLRSRETATIYIPLHDADP